MACLPSNLDAVRPRNQNLAGPSRMPPTLISLLPRLSGPGTGTTGLGTGAGTHFRGRINVRFVLPPAERQYYLETPPRPPVQSNMHAGPRSRAKWLQEPGSTRQARPHNQEITIRHLLHSSCQSKSTLVSSEITRADRGNGVTCFSIS